MQTNNIKEYIVKSILVRHKWRDAELNGLGLRIKEYENFIKKHVCAVCQYCIGTDDPHSECTFCKKNYCDGCTETLVIIDNEDNDHIISICETCQINHCHKCGIKEKLYECCNYCKSKTCEKCTEFRECACGLSFIYCTPDCAAQSFEIPEKCACGEHCCFHNRNFTYCDFQDCDNVICGWCKYITGSCEIHQYRYC